MDGYASIMFLGRPDWSLTMAGGAGAHCWAPFQISWYRCEYVLLGLFASRTAHGLQLEWAGTEYTTLQGSPGTQMEVSPTGPLGQQYCSWTVAKRDWIEDRAL